MSQYELGLECSFNLKTYKIRLLTSVFGNIRQFQDGMGKTLRCANYFGMFSIKLAFKNKAEPFPFQTSFCLGVYKFEYFFI